MKHNRQNVSFCSKMEQEAFVFNMLLCRQWESAVSKKMSEYAWTITVVSGRSTRLSHANEKAVDFYAVDLYLFDLNCLHKA